MGLNFGTTPAILASNTERSQMRATTIVGTSCERGVDSAG
jgi:hypothetical protein